MREAVEREKADGDAEHLDRLAAPAGGQHLEDHREQQDQHHALPAVGQAEAEDGTAHDRLADDRMGLQAGQDAELHAATEGDDQSPAGKLTRKSIVKYQGVSVRVDRDGLPYIKKKI